MDPHPLPLFIKFLPLKNQNLLIYILIPLTGFSKMYILLTTSDYMIIILLNLFKLFDLKEIKIVSNLCSVCMIKSV